MLKIYHLSSVEYKNPVEEIVEENPSLKKKQISYELFFIRIWLTDALIIAF